MTTTLNLKKQHAGHYSNKVEGIEISVTNSAVDMGGKSEWQLVITDDSQDDENWQIFNEWFPTKKAAYEFAVNLLIGDGELA